MMNKKRVSSTLCSLLVGLMLSAQVYAASPDVKLYRAGQIPEPTEIASMLSNVGGKMPSKKVRKRGITLLDDEAPANTVQATGEQEVPLQQVASTGGQSRNGNHNVFAVPIKFTASNDVAPESYAVLDAIAAGIKQINNKDSKRRVIVEAHTEKVNKSKGYNVAISREQAESVRNFLVYKHGIDSGSLEIVGKGRNDPLNKSDPSAPENARVQFYTAEAR